MAHQKKRTKVLYLCTGNSCRSQMAEALTRHFKSGVVDARSAGTDPHPIHPLTARVLEEIGVSLEGQRPKHVSELEAESFDYVVTLCGSAAETCPRFPRQTKVAHVGFEDPAAAGGDDEERLAAFRQVRDGILEFVENLPWELEHNQEEE